MKMLVNGKLYDVRFNPQYRQDHFGRARFPLEDTHCTISTVDESIEKGPSRYECVGEGTAYLSHNDEDNFDKWAGKKLAFGRALAPFNKKDCTEFWRIYKDTFPGRKFETKVSMDGCKKENSVRYCVRNIEDLPGSVRTENTEALPNQYPCTEVLPTVSVREMSGKGLKEKLGLG